MDQERRPRMGGGGGRDRRQDNDSDDRDDRRGGPRRGGPGGRQRRGRQRTYHCPDGRCFDYKEVDTLQRFVGETGKIRPRRQTGNCARCQRELAREVKRARILALLPYIQTND